MSKKVALSEESAAWSHSRNN